MTPKKPEEISPTVEPTPAPRTLGNRLFGWIGALVSRVATRFGIDPVLVKGVFALVVAVVVIVAVAVPISVFAQKPAPATPAAAPTQEPTTAIPIANDAPADGSCETLLDPAILADALGGSKEVSVASHDLVLAAVGGYDCRYAFGKTPAGWNDYTAADDNGYVDVMIAPTAIVSPDVLEASLTPMQCSSVSHVSAWSAECNSIVTTDHWWYSLSVRSFAEPSELTASFKAITDDLEHALVVAQRSSGGFVVEPFDCASASTGKLLVGTARGATEGTNELSVAASLLAAPSVCVFSDPTGEEWRLEVFPRGAEAYLPCTRNGRTGSPLSVDGVDSAFAHEFSSSDYSAVVCATDGMSTVVVTRSRAIGQSLSGWNAQSLEDLSALLVPVFAAIVGSTTRLVFQATSGAAPVVPFAGGDCSTVLDPATLAALAGGALDAHVVPGNPQLALVGGIDCEYHFGTQNEGVTGNVRVSVAPSMIIDPAGLRASLAALECRPNRSDSTGVSYGSACDATVVTGPAGWWYTLSANTDQSADELRAAFVTITAMLESTLKAVTAPKAVNVEQPFDCGTAEIGDLPWTRSRQLATGTTIAAATFLVVAPATCEYVTPDNWRWVLTIYPGQVSPFGACAGRGLPGGPPALPITVEGVESVLALDGEGDLLACATDGTSSVRVHRPNYSSAVDGGIWSEAARATLGSLLVPVFAAAS